MGVSGFDRACQRRANDTHTILKVRLIGTYSCIYILVVSALQYDDKQELHRLAQPVIFLPRLCMSWVQIRGGLGFKSGGGGGGGKGKGPVVGVGAWPVSLARKKSRRKRVQRGAAQRRRERSSGEESHCSARKGARERTQCQNEPAPGSATRVEKLGSVAGKLKVRQPVSQLLYLLSSVRKQSEYNASLHTNALRCTMQCSPVCSAQYYT